jgi:hypothetical protein
LVIRTLAIYVLLALMLPLSLSAQSNPEINPVKKRDPFVDLVDANGRIKTEDELFPSSQRVLPQAIILSGIIWDEKRPLAVINGKVYGENAKIGEGLILEKIDIDGILLSTSDNQKIRIDLKKKKEKK